MLNTTNVNVIEMVEGMGFEVAPYYKDKLDFLIKSDEDVNELISTINEVKHPTLLPVVNRIRMNRINQNQVTKGQFTSDYKLNPIEALEGLYHERVLQDDIETINRKGLTPIELYDFHTQNKKASFLTLLASR